MRDEGRMLMIYVIYLRHPVTDSKRFTEIAKVNTRHAVRINDQYRICFKWSRGKARDVEIADYH